MVQTRPLLDGGSYTMSETARYTGVPVATVRSWFRRRTAGTKPLLAVADGSVDDEHVVSFLGLVEAYVAGHFRAAGLPLPALRRVHDLMQDAIGTPRPFAHAFVRTVGLMAVRDYGGPELAVAARPSVYNRMKVDQFGYDRDTHLVDVWRISPGVVIEPGLAAGDPVIEGTGVKTYILSAQYYANYKDARIVADLYRVTEAEVLRATAFEGKLPKRAA